MSSTGDWAGARPRLGGRPCGRGDAGTALPGRPASEGIVVAYRTHGVIVGRGPVLRLDGYPRSIAYQVFDLHGLHPLRLSCKGRGIHPSCNTRRMAELAAHLTEPLLGGMRAQAASATLIVSSLSNRIEFLESYTLRRTRLRKRAQCWSALPAIRTMPPQNSGCAVSGDCRKARRAVRSAAAGAAPVASSR